jgi:aryl-alcohol dehydrogenase-like predicted oxidoreductase
MATTSLTTEELGRTGLDITRVGLGAWAIGGPWEFGWGPQDDQDSIAAIHEAIDQGVNWIDTAGVYGLGRSEEVVGRAVRERPEDERPFIFTKCGMVWEEGGTEVRRVGRPDSIKRDAEASLKRLGVDVIDLLQIHWPPEDVPVEEAWGAMVELRDEGKIRFAGVSNFSAAQLDDCEAIGHVDSLQPPLSLLQRAALASIDRAATNETGVIVYSPMQSGLLSGRWSRERSEQLAEDDWRRSSPLFTGEGLERSLALVERLKPLASREDASLAELAVAWTLHQHGVDAAIVGARKPGQVEGWIHSGEQYLEDLTRHQIADALRDTRAGEGRIPPVERL